MDDFQCRGHCVEHVNKDLAASTYLQNRNSRSDEKADELKYAFFLVSGSLRIIILLGQLASFLRIIFSTSAPLPVKVRWSLTLGSFVP